MGAKRTAWHFYFCILLRRYAPRGFEIRDEVPLSEEPPRIDYLILRRTADVSPGDSGETFIELWPRLPHVTIAELKTIPRPYEKGNLDRLWSYAHAYYAANHRGLAGRADLCALLIVPGRTPSLDEDTAAMGLAWVDLGHGYWRLTGGLFTLYVTEIDVVAGQPDEDLLGLYSHSDVRTPRALQFWGELAGSSEAKMEARELEGYEEAIKKIVSALPPELRLDGLTPEQRLAGLTPEQALLAMPDDALRALSPDYLATLSEPTRAAIRKRLDRS
jgi:hypothetical protein